ncbi:uncharacterized protein DFL_003352 [Arthrobotrys flagrans]|uniref:Uncharacterized protein n=1 Tax=Arthrobotrys flagrans TaxID=97331 RepID=A0A437A1L7_ARTFL|nr:hypothetical protein DFL_003352 [Arthrobotrys flagrans]
MISVAPTTSREGSKSIPPSPAVKRHASTDPSAKSTRADDSPTTTSCSPAQNQTTQTFFDGTDFDGLVDFSLPQNIKDIFHGPRMFMSGDAALSFADAIPQNLGNKQNFTTCPAEIPGITMPLYNFSDLELDVSDSLLDQNLTTNTPSTFNMTFLKHDNLDPFKNLEDVWRKYF